MNKITITYVCDDGAYLELCHLLCIYVCTWWNKNMLCYCEQPVVKTQHLFGPPGMYTYIYIYIYIYIYNVEDSFHPTFELLNLLEEETTGNKI